MENITFSDLNGNQLLGTLSIPKQADSVVIMSHGFQSSKESKFYVELQNELNEAGIGTFRYDYYGHGQLYCKGSTYTVAKDITLSKAVDSLKAAIIFIRGKGYNNIGLMGSSFGGLISLVVTSQDPDIKALALKSPVTEPTELWKRRVGDEKITKWKQEGVIRYNKDGEDFELNYDFWEDLVTYNIYEMAKNITCPVLIVHGDSDSVVPITQSHDLARIVNTKVRVVEGAGHAYSNPTQYTEMKQLIVDFLVEKFCS